MADLRSPWSRSSYDLAVGGTGPRLYSVRYAPASAWIDALETGHILHLVRDRMSAADVEDMATALALRKLSMEEVRRGVLELLAQAASQPKWWMAQRLCGIAAGESTAGHLTIEGVDPERVSLGQWCAAVYVLHTRNADKKDIFKFDSQLEAVPPGADDAWDDGSDFESMVQAARMLPGMS